MIRTLAVKIMWYRAHFFYDSFVHNIAILCWKGNITLLIKEQQLPKGINVLLRKGRIVENHFISENPHNSMEKYQEMLSFLQRQISKTINHLLLLVSAQDHLSSRVASCFKITKCKPLRFFISLRKLFPSLWIWFYPLIHLSAQQMIHVMCYSYSLKLVSLD